jgi:subtilisin family serine protease
MLFLLAPAQGWAGAPIDPALIAQAARDGSVPVLVGLDAPTRQRPESAAMAAARRVAIETTGQAVVQRLSPLGRARLRSYPERPLLAIDATPADLATLAAAGEVTRVVRNRAHRPSLPSTVPIVGAFATTQAGYTGAGSTVAVLDTGVMRVHRFFSGRIVEEACFSKNDSCPNGQATQYGTDSANPCTWAAICFHGTHVTGIALGEDGAIKGVAPGANAIAIQIFSEETGAVCGGSPSPCAVAYDSDIIAGLDHVESLSGSYDIASVNLSLGSGAYSSQNQCDKHNGDVKDAVDDLVDLEIAVIAASGNDGSSSSIDTPACLSSVISVGAVDDNDVVWSSSNSNSLLDLLAPGVSVSSSNFVGGYTLASGTSMAAPHVAGAFAVLRSADPTATRAQLLSALTSTGQGVLDSRNGLTRPRIQLDEALKSRAPADCFDGVDNDSDGDTDYPDDPGCLNGQYFEDPHCDDDLDNDGDGTTDWDGGSGGGTPDATCLSPNGASEAPTSSGGSSCGMGPELLVLLPLLGASRRCRRNREPLAASERPTP